MVDAGTIKVGFREGRLVVHLDDAILFDSGKAKLKQTGQEAIAELVEPLSNVKRDWIVGGHTDNVPIKTATFQSNWELSTARAVEVVNFLIEQGMPADRVGAAGYAEFDPVAKNSSKSGRTKNRRIELVLLPDLSEITPIIDG